MKLRLRPPVATGNGSSGRRQRFCARRGGTVGFGMVAKLGFFAVLFAAVGGLAAMGWRLVDRPLASPKTCPAAQGDRGARAAIAAFDAIQSDLTRGSVRDLNRQAAL